MNKRHACLILAHACPGQLGKLLGLLDDPRNDIYVHLDGKADFGPGLFTGCCRYSRLTFIEPRLRVNWGGVSIMRATLALLKAAVPGQYDYYHLLSGMDLPIKTQDEIHAFFDAHPGREFLSLWPVGPRQLDRCRYYIPFPEGKPFFPSNLANNIVRGILKLLHFRINRKVDFRMASQWFSITDGFARHLLSQEDWLERVFRHTGTCDEVFVPTVLWNSPFRDGLYDATVHLERERPADPEHPGNFRLIDWTRGESVRHPWVFRKEDWELLMAVPFFWARKFDERVDAEIIGRLYTHLKGLQR